ncbi:hypothetical protein WMY93_022185 [Mugilogobius chulae]|uniref:Uncharacterized protein n=1 Tax=Mugilogobius chulae TaxID=88201 RepID=A0AAW0NFW5_9GOBI
MHPFPLPLVLLLLTAYCISLFPAQIQALRGKEPTDTDRLDIINQLFDVSDDTPPSSPPSTVSGPLSKWLTSLLQHRSLTVGSKRPIHSSLSWARSSSQTTQSENSQKTLLLLPQLLRSRRHLSSRGTQHHHTQLMRVGCKLGTCQVQT